MPNKPKTLGSKPTAGFTFIEMMIYVVLLPVLVLAILSVVGVVRDVPPSESRKIQLQRSVRSTLRRLHDELVSASKVGEDTNKNSQIDAGEDLNGNTRLEADWSISEESLTFNRRLRTGFWSLPITYKLENGELIRSELLDTGKKLSAVLVRGVSTFTVSENQNEVTIVLGIQRKQRNGKFAVERETARVVMRN
jgi:hypothetical protein